MLAVKFILMATSVCVGSQAERIRLSLVNGERSLVFSERSVLICIIYHALNGYITFFGRAFGW